MKTTTMDLSNRIIGSIGLTYSITEYLSLRGKAMGDINLLSGSEFNNSGASYDPDGYFKTFERRTFNWNYEALLSFNQSFGDISVVATLGGKYF